MEYPGLISLEERTMLSRKQMSDAARRKAKREMDEGTGLFAMTTEERSAAGKKGTLAAIRARGKVPWRQREGSQLSEVEVLYDISLESGSYRVVNGRTLYNWGIMARRLNQREHKDKRVRTVDSVKIALCAHKRLRNEEED